MIKFYGLEKFGRAALLSVVIGVGSLAVSGAVSPAIAQATASFTRIDVSGNTRIAADTVRVIAAIPTGTSLTPGEVNEAKQRLVASGLFESVEVYPQGGVLVLEVVENPTINQVNIEGNRRIKDEDLLPFLQSQPRRAFSPVIAEQDVRAIAEAYAAVGRVGTQIEPKLIRRSQNRVDLVFQVTETRVAEVRRIGFVGNRVYSDRRLRRVLDSKQTGLFRALVQRDTFIQDRLEFDRQRLREFYLNRGFVDFEVVSIAPEFVRERNAFLLTYTVREGQQYRFGDISVIATAPDPDSADYEDILDIKSGKVFDRRRVDSVLLRLDERAGEMGLAFVQAVPRVIRNDLTRTVDIEFEMARAPRQFVERIDIEGNVTTLDRVIRRQFNIAEGDPLNRREVAEASDKIRATGFFANVNTQTREGSAPDQVIIDVDVEETTTGALSFGVGYSTGDGSSFTASLTERNFLGRGQTLGFSISTDSDEKQFRLSFTEPAWQDRDLLVGGEIFYTTTSRSSVPVNTVSAGFSPRIRFPLNRDSTFELKYRFSSESAELEDGETVSPIIAGDVEDAIVSSLSATYSLDRRNSRVDPTSGFIASVTQEFAGLGGDVTYSKTSGKFKIYRSLLNEDVILSAEVEGGVLVGGSGGSRFQDRFYLGGDNLRGFENFGVGPRDTAVAEGDPLGGNYFAVARLEASFPIGLPEEYNVFGGVFLDVGSVWGLDNTSGTDDPVDDSANLRSALGVSIFWEFALGPLRLNFSRPIKKEDYDTEENFRLTLDTRF